MAYVVCCACIRISHLCEAVPQPCRAALVLCETDLSPVTSMIPFEAPPSIPAKRKSDANEGPPRKRQTLGVASLGVQTYWSVQWSVGWRPTSTRSDVVLRVNPLQASSSNKKA